MNVTALQSCSTAARGPPLLLGAQGGRNRTPGQEGLDGPGQMAPLQTQTQIQLQSLKHSEQECLQLNATVPLETEKQGRTGSQGTLPSHCQAGPLSQDPDRWANQIPCLGGSSSLVLVWKVDNTK